MDSEILTAVKLTVVQWVRYPRYAGFLGSVLVLTYFECRCAVVECWLWPVGVIGRNIPYVLLFGTLAWVQGDG